MIRLENISHAFAEKRIFDDFNLVVPKGQFLVVMGDNGAGKSSIINLVSGSLSPNSGKVYIDNVDVTKKPEHKRANMIAHVFQDPKVGTNSEMTVRENLSLALHKGDFSLRRAISKKNDDKFKELGLNLNQAVGTLSGGQRQALSLTMATFNAPKILLLDEHTAALDPQAAKEILRKTQDIIKSNGLTAIMVTHNIPSAVDYGDRLIFMRNGKIVHDVTGTRTKAQIAEMFE